MLQVSDISELAYGGLVTGLDRWDKKRLEDAKIDKKDVLKKAGFYGYLVPGVFCTGATAFGFLRKYNPITERVTHGFIYGFPRFVMDMVDAFAEEPAAGSKSAALRAAEQIARASARAAVSAHQSIGQTSKPGFEDVNIY